MKKEQMLSYRKQVQLEQEKKENDYFENIDFDELYQRVIARIKEKIDDSKGLSKDFYIYIEYREDYRILETIRDMLKKDGFYVKIRQYLPGGYYSLVIRLYPNFWEKIKEKFKRKKESN